VVSCKIFFTSAITFSSSWRAAILESSLLLGANHPYQSVSWKTQQVPVAGLQTLLPALLNTQLQRRIWLSTSQALQWHHLSSPLSCDPNLEIRNQACLKNVHHPSKQQSSPIKTLAPLKILAPLKTLATASDRQHLVVARHELEHEESKDEQHQTALSPRQRN